MISAPNRTLKISMIGHIVKTALVLAALLLVSSCASGYYAKAGAAHSAYKRGEFKKSAEIIKRTKVSPRDRLLRLLDESMILHAAGEYEESNRLLSEAEEQAESFRSKSLSREISATLFSEEATEYAGERFERMFIPVIRLLNYIALENWNGAQVEVRKIQTTAEREYDRAADFDNAFSMYLSAMIWEASGLINDALIEYRRLAAQNKQVPYYAHDMKRISAKLGMMPKFPPKDSIAWQSPENYKKEDGELIVIVGIGQAPIFCSETVATGFFTVAMPTLSHEPALADHVEIKIDGKSIGRTYTFYNVTEDILKALELRRKRSFMRKLAKLGTQGALYGVSNELMKDDEIEKQLLGLGLALLGISMSAAEKADERSWRTLPDFFQIGRFFLKPGEYEVELVPSKGTGMPPEKISIDRDKPRFMMASFPQTTASGRPAPFKYSAKKSGTETEVAMLAAQVKKNPQAGNAKASLAVAKVKAGEYDVELLSLEAIKQGGSKEDAYFALITSETIKGSYANAAAYAQKALIAVPGSSVPFGEYAHALESLSVSSKGKTGPKIVFKDPGDHHAGALSAYINGLVCEKNGDFESATKNFAKSHQKGLKGDKIDAKIVENYKKTDEKFRKSKEGMKILDDFTDFFLKNL